MGWKVHRLTIIQCSNLTNCCLFFNISLSCGPHTSSISVAALGFLWYRSFHIFILILEKVLNCRYDLIIIGPILLPSQVYFHVGGKENSQMVPNQENMQGDQPVQSHSHAQQPLQPQTSVQEHCPGETGLPSSVFQTVLKCLYYFFSKSWITYQVWVYLKETMQLVSGKGEFNPCQVSLLWHNSFVVSLWTFQPTLVHKCTKFLITLFMEKMHTVFNNTYHL